MPDLLTRRAPFAPTTYDPTSRTLEAILSAGAGVERRDSKGPYLEICPIENARWGDSISLLDGHDASSARAVLGSASGIRVDNGQIIARLRLSDAADVESATRKIAAGDIRGISVGYRVEKWRESVENGRRVKTALAWTILECSAVSIPADPAAVTRSHPMPKPNKVESEIIEDDAVIEDANTPDPRIATRAAIRIMVRAAQLPAETADTLIDSDATEEEARTAIADAMGRRNTLARTIRVAQVGPSGDDPAVIHTRHVDGLFARVMGTAPSDAARPYAQDSLVDHARAFLTMRGESVRGMRNDEILTRAAQHTTSDFPQLLQGVGNRILMGAYQLAPNPLKQLARKGTRSDFRSGTALRVGEIGRLEKITESGEIKSKSRAEAGESYALDTFAAIFSLSRKAIINDDLGAMRDWATVAGKAASETEAKLLIDLLTANAGAGPTMSDTVALFHASHGNLAAEGSDVIGEDTDFDMTPLSAARLAMRSQKGLDGETPINATPKYLVVSATRETEVDRIMAQIAAPSVIDANVFGGALTPIIEARLSAAPWYVFADPAVLPVLEYSFLSGAEGPQLASREGWDVLGQEWRAVLDFGCGAVDWRGAYRNAGA